jgi:hypothetical protein
MGCDIHAYIDYDDFKTKDGDWFVSCFAEDVRLGRNYTLFTLMAGVRHDPRTDTYNPLFEPKGLPDRTSHSVDWAYSLHITTNKDLYDSESFCSPEDAQRWVDKGYSRWLNAKHDAVSHPDWHSASFLTVDELERVVEAFEAIQFAERSWFQFNPPEKQPIPENATATKMPCRIGRDSEWYVEVGEKKTYPAPTSLKATIAAMKQLSNDGRQARLVFWFDN